MTTYTYHHSETSTNTRNADNDRYETYVGMFGDVHIIDKTTLSSRIFLPLLNLGWNFVGLCFIGVFVYIALHILFGGMWMLYSALQGNLNTIICGIIAVIICVLTDKRVRKRK